MENDQTKQSFQRILFCTDLSENADFAFSYAVDAAMRRPGCELYLLHVIPESDSQFWKTYIYEVEGVDDKARHDIDNRIAESYTSKLPDNLQMQIEFRTGKDSEQILKFAREKDIDLIVMGRQGQSSLQKALFGNVTGIVARKAPCAVLVVPLTYKNKQANS